MNESLIEKRCSACGEFRSIDLFHKGTGLHKKDSRCKLCKKTNAADDYKRHKHKYMIVLKRSFCNINNIPFDLDEEYIDSIWTGQCPVLGVDLVTHDKSSDNNAQLDRVDPTKGYIKGNVVFISARANRLKNDGNIGEIRKILHWLESMQTS